MTYMQGAAPHPVKKIPNKGSITPTERLNAAVKSCGMTHAELAEKAGISARTVFSVLDGGKCQQDVKRRILGVLGIQFQGWRFYFEDEQDERDPG